MRNLILSGALSILSLLPMNASLIIGGKSYEVDTISQREIGPGIVHTMYRIPDYPLNINSIEMDLTNPYNRIENNQPYDLIGKQETLADAYIRHQAEGKHPIAAANANFWCVTGHGAGWAFMLGTNFGANVYNGKIMTETNCHSNQWSGGPSWACGSAIDTAKKLWINHMSWYGEAKCAKWDKALEIIQFNKICNEGELAVFTSNYGKNREMLTNETNDNIYFNVDEGQDWAVNKDMTATVKAISLNKANETIGDFDFCLTGSGAYKPYLEQLEVGDKITINHAWTVLGTGEKPFVENMVEGNAMIMENGELTNLNYDDSYCAQVYSRCGYGSSKDGKKLYIMVIDMSTSRYGYSAGCPTSVMSEILKSRGCWNLCNMDAGGSAQMLVDGKVINKTTEGTPRAVSCSWMLYSTAPKSEEIARIEFDEHKLIMPTGASYSPKILGYNQYGDIINEDVKGIILSCDSKFGITSDNVVVARAEAVNGLLTASYNGIKVSKPISSIDAGMTLRIKPEILIDGNIEYPIEVTSTIGRNTFYYDPSHLQWEVGDPTVAEIVDGVLKGKKNGETTIKCVSGDFSDETKVKVEIANSPVISQSWTGWTLKAVGAKDLKISNDGILSLNYTGGRGQYIKLFKELYFYSIPDKIVLDFTSSLPLDYIQADYRNATMESLNYITYGKGEGYKAGEHYQLELKITDLGDVTDLMNYPIRLKEIGFYPSVGGTKGAHTITIHGLNAEYAHYSGVENIEITNNNLINIYPNPVKDGMISISAEMDNCVVEIYNQSGNLLKSKKIDVNYGTATMDVSQLSKGFYFIKVSSKKGLKIEKIIVK